MIAPSIPRLLLRPLARAAMPPAIAIVQVAVKHPPLKLVFAFDFDVRHNYSQHLFMDINSRYPIGHSSSWPGAESVLRLP
jgi:hypothetical protein